MKFLNYWPLAFLILVPVIIIMYMLKQRAMDYPFSSTFLWKELYANRQSDTPWEKLKKNLLMYLQILTLFLLILAMCSPYLLSGGKKAESVVIVIDNSASMTTRYNDKHNRLQEAKDQAIDYLEKMNEGASITLITSSSSEPQILMTNSKDKSQAIDKIKDIKETDFAGNMTSTVDLVRTLQLQMEEGTQGIFFSDYYFPLTGVNGYVVNLDNEQQNAGVDYVSYGYQDNGMTVITKITNYGTSELDSDINLYGDDSILAIQHVKIPAGESQVVYFEGIGFYGKVICAEINEKDALEHDNRCYDVIHDQNKVAKVLLLTEQNLYLEKALSLNDKIDLTKSGDIKNLASFEAENYDLYVFDGLVPDELPKKGNVILFNVPMDDLYESTYHAEGMMVHAGDQPITKYMEKASFGVSGGYTFKTPAYAESFLYTKAFSGTEECVGFYGINGTQKMVVLGFDIHNTQLPLTIHFPILIHNLLSETIATGMTSSSKVDCGNSMQISSAINGDDVIITKPDATTTTLPTGTVIFSDASQVGIYKVEQTHDGETSTEQFAVNFPSSESDSRKAEVADADSGTKIEYEVSAPLNLRNYLIILALILLGVEWIVYMKES